MKRSKTIASALALSLGLGIAASAYAHQGSLGGAMGQGPHRGLQHDVTGGHEGRGGGAELMTSEERTAFHEKMRAAKTPEERQQIARAHRADVQMRAQEKGITLHERRGSHGHRGGGSGNVPAPQVPTESVN